MSTKTPLSINEVCDRMFDMLRNVRVSSELFGYGLVLKKVVELLARDAAKNDEEADDKRRLLRDFLKGIDPKTRKILAKVAMNTYTEAKNNILDLDDSSDSDSGEEVKTRSPDE
jgi:hypothetical protein